MQTVPVDLFDPACTDAASIDGAIRTSLNHSLEWCFGHAGLAPASWSMALDGWNARPVDFGRYYDLVVALNAADGTVTDAVRGMAQRLLDDIIRTTRAQADRAGTSGLAISTLRQPWYGAGEVECIVRWFDIEPENAMGLSPLDDAELSQARSNLRMAISAMEVLIPEFLDEMLSITTEIVFAKPSGQQQMTFGGASSFSLWGAVALNSESHPDWWQYLPRLVHEYSHNLLFGIARNEPLVLNDPQERYPSPLREELRPVDGIFHAAFVSAREVLALRKILARLNEGSQPHRFAGIAPYCRQTLADSERSFDDCLSVIQQYGHLSELGRSVLRDAQRALSVTPAAIEAASR